MSQIIPIFIPTYIGSVTYAPVRVLPRLLFYNGLLDCENYFIEGIQPTGFGLQPIATEIPAFPYFDNYNVVTGSFPTTGSLSLLFNNETAVYGTLPNQNLYTEYWQKYISLLYNPYTRLLNCSAIIPLADYFEMELNDIVNFRGNYYHLRAINDYSLKDGSCQLQLLGPIIPDSFDINDKCDFDFSIEPVVGPTTTTTSGPTTTTTSTTSTTTEAPITTNGLVLWSRCNSLYGNIWYDASGNGNNGLVSGSALSATGSLGYAFNGTNNYITYPTVLNGQPSSSYTLQYYGSLPSESTNRDMFCKEVYTNGWDTIYRGEDQRDFVLRDEAGGDMISPAITSSLATKKLITITVNEITNVLQLYVNSTFIGNLTGFGIQNPFDSAAVPFVFGFNANSDADYWKGGVSDLLLYNKVLNSGEITQNFNVLSNRTCIVSPTTTTTTQAGSTTTTTTAGPTYNYYDVTLFYCPSCTVSIGGLVARNNTTNGTLITGNYYNNGDGFVYRIEGYNAGPSYTINLDGAATAGTNCSATCAI